MAPKILPWPACKRTLVSLSLSLSLSHTQKHRTASAAASKRDWLGGAAGAVGALRPSKKKKEQFAAEDLDVQGRGSGGDGLNSLHFLLLDNPRRLWRRRVRTGLL